MRLLHSLLAATALIGLSLTAHADTLTYNVSGAVSASAGGAPNGGFSGTVTFNTTTYIFVSSNITVSAAGGPPTVYDTVKFTYADIGTQFGYVGLGGAGGASAFLNYALPPNPVSGAITICPSGQTCGPVYPFTVSTYFGSEYVTSGTLTPVAVAATPEPSSLILLGTGVLGLAGAIRRRAAGLLRA